jgi:hypothetical protein
MDRREAANYIIMNIAGRDRHDMILYPGMIAVVMLSYLSIFSFYIASLFSRYGRDVPWEQMFGAFALLVMGVSIILAIFYLLMTRNAYHSRRESSLRKAMASYIEANACVCGTDVTIYAEKLRRMDSKFDSEERMGNPRILMIWIVIPALAGFLLMWIPDLRDNALIIVIVTFLMSLILAAVISPHTTSFASEHDKRTKEFTAAFCDACRTLGIKLVPTSKTVGRRSFRLFILLTAVTFGFFSIVWVYFVFNDMNKHFLEQWRFEDSLLRTVRDTEITCSINAHGDATQASEDTYL